MSLASPEENLLKYQSYIRRLINLYEQEPGPPLYLQYRGTVVEFPAGMHVADFYTYCASLGVTYPDYRASCKQAELQPVDQRVYAMQYNRWRAISTVCKEIERVVREFEFGRHFLMRIEPRDIANKLFLDDSFCESEFAALLN